MKAKAGSPATSATIPSHNAPLPGAPRPGTATPRPARPSLGFVLCAAFLCLTAIVRPAAAAPAAGDPAPDFRLPYATADTLVWAGEALSTAVQQGPVVLAFYPADWSPGCTKEVCTLRDAFAELGSLRATVWGISGDTVFSHRAWAEHHRLPFRLVSDMKHEAARAYGSFNEESGFTRRTVYVVGKEMRVLYADPDYSVKDETDFKALRDALQKLRG